MKSYKLFTALFTICVSLVVAPVIVSVSGCRSSSQQVAYNTIYSVEKTAVAAYDGYIDQVLAGNVGTNDLPRVSKAFNKFQAGVLVALDVVQFNTNALAPASLVIESQDLINLITTLTKK